MDPSGCPGKGKLLSKRQQLASMLVQEVSCWHAPLVDTDQSLQLLASVYLLCTAYSTRPRRVISFLLNSTLFLLACFYAYRDIYPLATFSLHPIDPAYLPTVIAWARGGLIIASGTILPLIQHRIYTPIDPLHPSPVPHPRQSSSIISRAFFLFIDPFIIKAWRNPQISYDELPPVPDTDKASYLLGHVLPDLDPVERKKKGLKQRSLLTLILAYYWDMYAMMALMMVIKAVAEFASPIALNSLLSDLQDDNKERYYRPWFWIALLAVGPTISSITMAYYQSLSTSNLVRLECVCSQLLFNHFLRVKMQDGSDATTGVDLETAPVPTILVEDGDAQNKGAPIVEDGNQVQVIAAAEESDISAKEDKKSSGTATPKESAPQAAAAPKEASIAGRLNTLMTSDVDNVLEAREFLKVIVYGPLQIALGAVFLYRILSWSALVGMAVNVLTLPIPGYLAKMMNTEQKKLMKKTDLRVQAVTEVLQTLKMVKLFAWEPKVKEQIAEKREEELAQVWNLSIIGSLVAGLNFLLPVLTMLSCYGCYTGIQGRSLTAAKIFSSLTVFDMIRGQMHLVTGQIQALIGAKVSLERLNNFLHGTEMLDKYEKEAVKVPAEHSTAVCIRDATFYWTSASKRGRGGRQFCLEVDKITFPDKVMSVVAGPTGCGKTSLLMALLGEMAFEPRSAQSMFNLPRGGGVSYAAQDSWVMADTIKNNILFGTAFDAERYNMVIRQCALERDLELFAAGDETELGEKGLNASGGQKARISLARAFYARSAIVLLDDVLSALDVHTTQFIVGNLFKGPLAKDRTIILVTHHVSLVKPVADYLVNMSLNGTIASQGPVDKFDLFTEPSDAGSSSQAQTPPVAETPADELGAEVAKVEKASPDGKLVIAEEKASGRVSRGTLFRYFSYAGGVIFWIIYWLDIFAGEVLFAYCNYFLGLWSKAFDKAEDPRDVNIAWWMSGYVFLMLLQVGSYESSTLMWTFGSLKAARTLHESLVDHVLGASMRFLDQTPVGRLIGRFTKDMQSVDRGLRRIFQGVSEISVTLLLKFFLLVWLVPTFAPYALLTGVLGLVLGEFYLKAQLSIKREMSNAKTPLYTHFAAASNGLVSIRAYGAEKRFQEHLGQKADVYTGTATIFYDVNRWIGVRIDLLGALFASVLSAFMVYATKRLDVFVLGFAINQAISFAEIILVSVRVFNEFEVQANGIERINDYLVIEQEPAPTTKGTPPAAWPTDGSIEIKGLQARYYAGGPIVLNNINVDIKSGERVGIVGRTGSGKSTMTLALLRMIPTEGTIRISGVDMSKINLNALRSQLTIIPQDPVLLAGTLRYNLDPFDSVDDMTLNDAMRISGLTSSSVPGSVGAATPMAITLDTNISSGGGNLSSGQRQLVSLARALCRGSKVMILDEATASVDFATDALVQTAIRKLKDITILTVAHRLSTVMDYDKIMVLDAGKVMEYDTPYALLQKPDGMLRAMVNNASNKEELERLAKEKTG
ncbi:hypothetical protein P7C73_g1078, partial [Tremellales sp. Uapishka_1]